MRKSLLIVAAALFLTSCGGVNTNSTVQDGSDDSAAVSDEVLDLETTASAMKTTVTSDTSQTSLTSDDSTLSSVTAQTLLQTGDTLPATTLAQGGQGGEEHASDPEPDYFTYRFFPESVSMRLAGGNYQTIFYDLADAIEHDVDEKFYLADFNFDGKSDLSVPVNFEQKNITYAVFLWNRETLLFETDPILLCNPSVSDETKQVVCVSYDPNTSTETKLQFLVWDDNAPIEIEVVTVDYTDLTLTDTNSDQDTVTESYDTAEALRDALLTRIPSV